MTKNKFYAVWQGRTPGIYTSWKECSEQVLGFKNAKFESFSSLDEATKAYYGENNEKQVNTPQSQNSLQMWTEPCIVVDGACSGNPGQMEYRGLHLPTKTVLFHYLLPWGTNNIAEFLAIIEGLKYSTTENVYSDSAVAISWVLKNKCNTKLTELNQNLQTTITTAENWLKLNPNAKNNLKKWNTSEWGEIPADFGRS